MTSTSPLKGDISKNSEVIRVAGLAKSYNSHPALRQVDFTVRRGEILAYLGPNGAGKTTTIKILGGLLSWDAGEVKVCGLDVAQEPVAIKRLIGVVPEESNLYPELSCQRNLDYLGELYGLPRSLRKSRTAELLAQFELGERALTPFGALSRGLKRRLTIAGALIHDPEVLFLDEPTTGLDVLSARALRDLVRFIHRQGKTVFLTTHNLQEAEALCQRVVILIRGRVAAEGTTTAILASVRRCQLVLATFSGEVSLSDLRRSCPAVVAGRPHNGAWRLEISDLHAALAQLLAFADSVGLRLEEISTVGPSLEEAFLEIVQENPGASGRGS